MQTQASLFRLPQTDWVVSLGAKPVIFTSNLKNKAPKLEVRRGDLSNYVPSWVYKPVINWMLSADKKTIGRVVLPLGSTPEQALSNIIGTATIPEGTRRLVLWASKIVDNEATKIIRDQFYSKGTAETGLVSVAKTNNPKATTPFCTFESITFYK